MRPSLRSYGEQFTTIAAKGGLTLGELIQRAISIDEKFAAEIHKGIRKRFNNDYLIQARTAQFVHSTTLRTHEDQFPPNIPAVHHL